MIEISEGKTHIFLPAETLIRIAGLNGRLAGETELVIEGEHGPDELAASFVAGRREDLLPLLAHRSESGATVRYSLQGERCQSGGEETLKEALNGLTLKKLYQAAKALEIEIPGEIKRKAEVIEQIIKKGEPEAVKQLATESKGAPSS